MWRGFGAEAEADPPPQRSYFRPRISSISGVLAMTKQRLFTSGIVKDDVNEHVAHTASIHPVGSGPSASGQSAAAAVAQQHLLTESYLLNGGLMRCPSPARSSFGDVMSFSRSASARPSIDSQAAHAIYGIYGDLGIHDPSEAELGGVCPDNDGRLAKRSRKIVRGLLLMVIVSLCWVGAIHLFRLSFHTERELFTVSPVAGTFNISKHLSHYRPTTTAPYYSRRQSKQIDYPRSNFDAPYLVTWYCSIWNILFLPIYLLIHWLFLSRRLKTGHDSNNESAVGSTVSNNAFGSNVSSKDESIENENNPSIKKVLMESIQGLIDKGFTAVQFFSRCAFFCVLWVLANYMLIFSLRILDATVVMAILSCTVSIIYLLSWVVLHQQFVGIRIVAIIICDTGIALLVYMDGIQQPTLATVMIVFGSAVVFAVYKVFMRRMIGYTTFAQMALFHTLVGIMCVLIAWPLGLILYATGVETIVWSAIPWSYLTGAATCMFIANVIANFGLICTYEVLITLGMFFAIPISALIDIYINSVIFRDMKLSGILLILCGFVVVLLPDNWNQYLTSIFRNRIAKWKRREEMKKIGGRVQDTTTGQLSRLRTSSGRVK